MDCDGTSEFFLGAREFFGGQTERCELVDFIVENGFDFSDFCGVGAHIEGEIAGDETVEFGRADEVGQPHFFADAVEKARTEVV